MDSSSSQSSVILMYNNKELAPDYIQSVSALFLSKMTNISMISPTVFTLPAMNDVHNILPTLTNMSAYPTKAKVPVEIPNQYQRKYRTNCVWTNFHSLLSLGISGFLVFWTLLLLR